MYDAEPASRVRGPDLVATGTVTAKFLPAMSAAATGVTVVAAQLAAVYRRFDFDGPPGLVKAAAGPSDQIVAGGS